MFKEGVININKPSGWTSQDVCAKLRGRLHIKRIGHTGTLDPMATGVLPVCIGRATRLIEYYDKDIKTYHANMKLGIVTDTLDITGQIIKETLVENISEQDVINCIKSFVGKIEQIPPKYSAIKINGKRAYDLAREGKDFEIKPRKIIIESIDNIEIDLNEALVSFDVSCSKGTYIRTLCDDIGSKLGCGATLIELIRLKSGFFLIEKSKTINEIVELSDDEINELIMPVDETLEKLGEIQVNDNYTIVLQNGNDVLDNWYRINKDTLFSNRYKVYSNNTFRGIGRIENNLLKMEKVITFENI